MSTTTIRIDDDLRASVAEAARIEGVSAHAFMVEAIARRTRELAEREAFIALASERWEQFLRDGKSVSLDEMREKVRVLAAGKGAAARTGGAVRTREKGKGRGKAGRTPA